VKHRSNVPLARGVQAAWYERDPDPRPRFEMDAQLAARAAAHVADPYTPFFEFNREYLRQEICGPTHDRPGGLSDFFFFEPVDPQPFPTFRHLRHVSPPSWFVTNNFGWRGPDLAVNRAAQVIRVAFVGASTTVDSYSVPFSHPERLEPWLNLWAAQRAPGLHFDVLNTGRTGIDSRSMAAIVRTELVPFDPDLVVFYGEANQFTPGGVLHTPLKRFFPKPRVALRERTALERYSALVRRVRSAWDRFRGGEGDEPPKPAGIVTWPSGVDESAPDPYDSRLPMDLPRVIRNLDDMRAALAPGGGQLVLSSFIWLAHAGLKLDLVRHANTYRYLNDAFWPIPYAHIRRMADFQNRVLERYARRVGAPFVDVDRTFPRDPDLFDDPVHLNDAGLRLMAWIYLQELVPLIDERLASGQWPRPAKAPVAVHPAFDQPDRRLVTAADIAAHCS
jgi:hypothetical protein